jgi:hypothetical protein
MHLAKHFQTERQSFAPGEGPSFAKTYHHRCQRVVPDTRGRWRHRNLPPQPAPGARRNRSDNPVHSHRSRLVAEKVVCEFAECEECVVAGWFLEIRVGVER